MRKKVIALVSNNIATDQRLIKVGNTLRKNDFEFLLIGTKHRGKPNLAHIPFQTKRANIFFQKNFLFYAELQFRLLFELFKVSKKNSILLANDLDSLIPGSIISKLYKIPLVVDFHEIYSEMPSLKERSIQKKVWKFLERKFVPGLKHTYTVSDSYANWFNKEYGIQPKIIKNVPMKRDFQAHGRKSEQKVIIYQGAINQSRGIDKMILALQFLENVQLWIIGDGPLLEECKMLAKEFGVEDKVTFYGRLKPEELGQLTPKADLGLSLEEDNGLSYRYALPNKIFDYIHAGIPTLGSCDLPEMKNIISEYQIGDTIENHNAEHIAEKIEDLLKIGKESFKDQLKKAAKDLNWENQEKVLVEIFRQAGNE